MVAVKSDAYGHGVAPLARAAVEAGADALAVLDSGALTWTLLFNGNPAPLGLLTMAMLHESHHHLHDITQLAGH